MYPCSWQQWPHHRGHIILDEHYITGLAYVVEEETGWALYEQYVLVWGVYDELGPAAGGQVIHHSVVVFHVLQGDDTLDPLWIILDPAIARE